MLVDYDSHCASDTLCILSLTNQISESWPTEMTTQKLGPRKGPDGKMLARSLLGDPEDFESMSREQTRVRSTTPRNSVGEFHPSNNSENQLKTPGDTAAMEASAVSKAETLMDSLQEGLDREAELRSALAVLSQTKTKQREDRSKKLKAMHIFERFDDVRGPRALARHQKRLAEWEAFRKRMAKQLNKDIDDLVISRSPQTLLSPAAPHAHDLARPIPFLSLRVPPRRRAGPRSFAP